MAQGKVEICGVNTAKLPLLREEEKEALFLRIKAGDAAAKEEYIRGNLRLVLSVIKRFSNTNENPDDLFQVGCIGLMKAIDNFDLSQGVRFSTYAVPMIIGEIRRYLRDNNSIRVSRSLRDTAYKAIYAREAFIKRNNREPSVMEVAGKSASAKKMWSLPWMPYRVRCPSMNRFIRRAEINSASWIRSVIRKTARRPGWRILRSSRPSQSLENGSGKSLKCVFIRERPRWRLQRSCPFPRLRFRE